jgi:sulfur carrier protein
MIKISVNNEVLAIAPQIYLSEALNQWGYADTKIAVAINGEFVPRSTYTERQLHTGDKVDIVKPVGGG